ncbi:MAG TPA: glycosyltransferase family 4 protein, partial [Candidatus Binatia bacterium]
MRVLVWQETFWPYVGGIEVLAPKLFSALKQRGYEIIVVTRQDSPDLAEQEDYQGIRIYRFPFWTVLNSANLGEVIELRSRVAELKRAFAPDLVHLNSFGPSVVLHHDTAIACGAPLLVTLHTTPQHMNAGSLGRDGLFGKTLRKADWVTCVSKAVLTQVRQLVPEVATYSSVAYTGLVAPAFFPDPLPTNPPRLLCLGRLVPEKGFDLALKAFASIVDRFPSARLVIAGDGPARSFLENQATELGLQHCVEFVGWVTPERVPELINTATVVIMPSRNEGLGSVALEAALMARPIVAARVGGLPEIVLHRKTGLLVDDGDQEALAE